MEKLNTLTKRELAKSLVEEVGLNKRKASYFVDDFFEEIRLALENGNPLHFSGFGNFVLRDKKERPGRNPKTGECLSVTARRVVTFKPSNQLRKKVMFLLEEGENTEKKTEKKTDKKISQECSL